MFVNWDHHLRSQKLCFFLKICAFSRIYIVSRRGFINYRSSIFLDHSGHTYVDCGLIVALREKNSPKGGVRVLHVDRLQATIRRRGRARPWSRPLGSLVLFSRSRRLQRSVRHKSPLRRVSMPSFWTVFFSLGQAPPFEFANSRSGELSPNDTVSKRASGESRDRSVSPFFPSLFHTPGTRSFAHSWSLAPSPILSVTSILSFSRRRTFRGSAST